MMWRLTSFSFSYKLSVWLQPSNYRAARYVDLFYWVMLAATAAN
jgi:hypothetical protein